MEKVVRNGKVAILISDGFGIGWYSYHREHQQLLFHPKLVEMVEQGKSSQINENWVKENLNLENIYCGGASTLQIHWLPIGTAFIVKERDGEEYLEIKDFCIIA